MRIIGEPALGERNLDLPEKFDRAPPRGATPEPGVVPEDPLGQLVADPLHRVERAHRVLEDERDLLSPHALQPTVAEPTDVAPVQPHLATHDSTWRFDEPEDGQRQRR